MQEYSFGSWVKRRRKVLDLTQQDLAERVGCSHSLIYKIEADARRPSRQIAQLMADHLEIPPDQRELFLKIARQERRSTDLDAIQPPPPPDLIPTSDSQQASFPAFPVPLIGREREVRAIMGLLLDPACRMLTLTGPGGIGKTRLAIESGRLLQQRFRDGVAFVSMAGVSMIESIVPAIADALGLTFSGPADPLVQLAVYLRSKEILLIIDNMEHVAAGGGLLGEILQRTKKTRFLLTSREQLHLQWEWLFEVQGLPVPAGEETDLEGNSAILLFTQRALQISQDFIPAEEDIAALVRICKLVGGSPLAIELAASWVRILSCQEIAAELERSLDILETKNMDVPARHRSIRSVFDHSWKLLDEEECAVLMRLSVFQGDFTREAAYHAAGATLVVLSALVEKSLVQHHKDRNRYDLHELIHQYALARLSADPDEKRDAFEVFAGYYTDWIASLENPLKSSRQLEISQKIRTETSNWLAGWNWAIEQGRLDLLRKMAPCLGWYFEVHGYYAEALSAFNTAMQAFRTSGAPDALQSSGDKSAYASLVDQVGWFEFRMGNVEKGAALLAESLEIAREDNDPEVLYYIYGNWGYLCLWKGEFKKAEQLTLESLALSRQLTPWHTAVSLSVLGIVAYEQGDLRGGYEQLSESLRIFRTVGDSRGLVFCMVYLGIAAFALDDLQTAESITRESNAIAEANNDRWALAYGLNTLGMLAFTQGRHEQALENFQRSARLSEEIGDQLGRAQLMVQIGQVYTALGEVDRAKALLREIYFAAREARWGQIILLVLISLAEIPGELPAETTLALTMTMLDAPGVTPIMRRRCLKMQAEARSQLTDAQIQAAAQRAEAMSVENWADELFR